MYYSITFGNISDEGLFVPVANTWDDWHLIPSSRPTIVTPQPVTNFIKIPGAAGTLDLSDYLRGVPELRARDGSIEFYVENGYEEWTDIRKKIHNVITGQSIKMVLEDDPGFYYQGRVIFSNWNPLAGHSTVTLQYHLDPYKYSLYQNASEDVDDDLWDLLNFEADKYKTDVIWLHYNESTDAYDSSLTELEDYTTAVYKKERYIGGLL